MFNLNLFIKRLSTVLVLFFASFFLSYNITPAYMTSNKKLTPPDNLTYEIYHRDKLVCDFFDFNLKTAFSHSYTDIPGILTFRGDNSRTSPSYGFLPKNPSRIEVYAKFKTSSLTWGGGAGWTGQPLVVKWPKETLSIMNVFEKFKDKNNFVEVICISLDGRIYFFDLSTGEQSRNPIFIKNPIKGTPSIDPRGYPILYVGQGIDETGSMGFRLFNLIDGSLMHFFNGYDKLAYRSWGAFDSSPLIDRENDTLILCGENGLVYFSYLNTLYNPQTLSLSVSPVTYKLRYSGLNLPRQGIESSPAAYKNYIYFADNTGLISCINTMTLEPAWKTFNIDDTDATLIIDAEKGKPCLYAGNEVDHQGEYGNVHLRKYDGISGTVLKELIVPAYSIIGNHPVNGGVLGTPILGKHDISDTVIFQIARYNSISGGLLIALDKNTFKEKWRIETHYYSWSSPVDVYTESGESYIINCDSIGNVSLIQGRDGSQISDINLHGNIESSPVVYNNKIIVPSRNGHIYFLSIK